MYRVVALAKLLPEAFEPLSELAILSGVVALDGRREWIVPDVKVAQKTARYYDSMLAEPPLLGIEILFPGAVLW